MMCENYLNAKLKTTPTSTVERTQDSFLDKEHLNVFSVLSVSIRPLFDKERLDKIITCQGRTL